MIWLVPVLTWPFTLTLPLISDGWGLVLPMVGLAVSVFGIVVYNVGQVSYRQAICPDHLLGRMNASIRWVVWGATPLGALVGGVLGSWIGIVPTLWVSLDRLRGRDGVGGALTVADDAGPADRS